MPYPEVPRINRYAQPTIELVLSLLAQAYEDEAKLDRVLQELSEDVFRELAKELTNLEKSGKIDLSKPFDLRRNSNVYQALKRYETIQLRRLTDYYWIGHQVIKDSLTRTCLETLNTTYTIFHYKKRYDPYYITSTPDIKQLVQIRDTHIYDHYIKIPWCQDGKTYSDRLYGHVSQFQAKLAYVLEEGIANGRGLEWMQESWRKLTGSTAYDTARLLKTETMAMWSQATKDAYLEMGIEYVEILGDAECGGICLDYVGEAIPLAEAMLGDLLPPYHPNCACSYVAYEEAVPAELAEEYDEAEELDEDV